MSSNWADLEGSLAASGLPASAAKLIANALANLDSPRTTTGENRMDSTPSQALRMIDADARRYRFTNLDQRSNAVARRAARNRDTNFLLNEFQHPYDNTQPIKGGESITRDRVEAGKFVSVAKSVDDGTVSYEVGLEVQGSGQFVGVNQTRDVLRTLDFSVTSGDPATIKAVPNKQENSTNIAISPINLQTITVKLSDNTTRNILSWVPDSTINAAPTEEVYEEGTWTPTYTLDNPPSAASNWTFATQRATYTRRGKFVFYDLRYSITTAQFQVNRGKIDVTGLPYRVAETWFPNAATEVDLPVFSYATPGNNAPVSDPNNYRIRMGATTTPNSNNPTITTNVFACGFYEIHPDAL